MGICVLYEGEMSMTGATRKLESVRGVGVAMP